MSHDVFISYKSEDKAQALWVKENLEANGISCWMAPESIPGGSNYAMEIAGAMAQCRCVVVTFTTKTQTSMWVDKEIELALNMQKTVLPFMLEAVPLQGSFQLYLSNVQQYAAYQNPKEAMTELVRDIRKLKGMPVGVPKIVSKPTFGASKMSAAGVIGLVIGLLLLAAILWLVIAEVGSPLLGVAPDTDAPATTTASSTLTEDTTTTVGSNETHGAPSSTDAPPAVTPTAPVATTTTGAVVQPTPPQVIGAADLNAVIDCADLATHQTNLSRQTAATLPMDGMMGGVLQKDTSYWYGFTTSAEMNVYRVAGLRVNGEDTLFDLYVTLYDAAGLKQKEIYIARHKACGYEDFVLEADKQYYVKVSSGNLGENVTVGYGLFVSPRASDTGLGKEDVTKLVLGEQYTFTLNSSLDDWFVFKAEEPGHDMYLVTVYNVDVGGAIDLIGTDAKGGTVCSLSVPNEDSEDSSFYASNGKTVYFQVGAHYDVDDPDGTYAIVVTTYY